MALRASRTAPKQPPVCDEDQAQRVGHQPKSSTPTTTEHADTAMSDIHEPATAIQDNSAVKISNDSKGSDRSIPLHKLDRNTKLTHRHQLAGGVREQDDPERDTGDHITDRLLDAMDWTDPHAIDGTAILTLSGVVIEGGSRRYAEYHLTIQEVRVCFKTDVNEHTDSKILIRAMGPKHDPGPFGVEMAHRSATDSVTVSRDLMEEAVALGREYVTLRVPENSPDSVYLEERFEVMDRAWRIEDSYTFDQQRLFIRAVLDAYIEADLYSGPGSVMARLSILQQLARKHPEVEQRPKVADVLKGALLSFAIRDREGFAEREQWLLRRFQAPESLPTAAHSIAANTSARPVSTTDGAIGHTNDRIQSDKAAHLEMIQQHRGILIQSETDAIMRHRVAMVEAGDDEHLYFLAAHRVRRIVEDAVVQHNRQRERFKQECARGREQAKSRIMGETLLTTRSRIQAALMRGKLLPDWLKRQEQAMFSAYRAGNATEFCRVLSILGPMLSPDEPATRADLERRCEAIVRTSQTLLGNILVRSRVAGMRKAAYSGHSDTYNRSELEFLQLVRDNKFSQ